MVPCCIHALAVAAVLTAAVATTDDLDEEFFSSEGLSLLQLRSHHSDPVGNTEYLSMFRPCGTCKDQVRIGDTHDGGYVMCGDLLNSDVTGAYSFGILGNDNWGAEISTRLGITIHQGDCYNTTLPPCPAEHTCNFDFQPVCIGDNIHPEDPDGGSLRFESLQQRLEANGDLTGSGNLLLKMDVEGSEWSAFADESAKTVLKRFSQIIVEFHYIIPKDARQSHNQQQQAMRNLLEDFIVVHLHQNNCCGMYTEGEFTIGNLVELTFVRRDLIEEGTCDTDPPQSGHKNAQEFKELPEAHLPGGQTP